MEEILNNVFNEKRNSYKFLSFTTSYFTYFRIALNTKCSKTKTSHGNGWKSNSSRKHPIFPEHTKLKVFRPCQSQIVFLVNIFIIHLISVFSSIVFFMFVGRIFTYFHLITSKVSIFS